MVGPVHACLWVSTGRVEVDAHSWVIHSCENEGVLCLGRSIGHLKPAGEIVRLRLLVALDACRVGKFDADVC